MLDHKTLVSLLDYDLDAGQFHWRVNRQRARKGGVAGGINPRDSYWYIKIEGRSYSAHRLAWFYVTGDFPAFDLDHKNTIKHDNRFENLRPATDSLNGANRERQCNNKSGFKGVHPRAGRWCAQITYAKKYYFLGIFDDPAVAHAAYVEAAQKLFGEFARG
jgi:Demerecviridae HNH endonuclease